MSGLRKIDVNDLIFLSDCYSRFTRRRRLFVQRYIKPWCRLFGSRCRCGSLKGSVATTTLLLLLFGGKLCLACTFRFLLALLDSEVYAPPESDQSLTLILHIFGHGDKIVEGCSDLLFTLDVAETLFDRVALTVSLKEGGGFVPLYTEPRPVDLASQESCQEENTPAIGRDLRQHYFACVESFPDCLDERGGLVPMTVKRAHPQGHFVLLGGQLLKRRKIESRSLEHLILIHHKCLAAQLVVLLIHLSKRVLRDLYW